MNKDKLEARRDEQEIFSVWHTRSEQTSICRGEKSIILNSAKSVKKGDFNKMHWPFPNHISTHIDGPIDFIKNGLFVTHDTRKIRDCEVLVNKTGFKTQRDKEIYWKNCQALFFELALWMKGKSSSVRAVGIAFISISSLNKRGLGREAHMIFLGNNILLIEDVELSGIDEALDTVKITTFASRKSACGTMQTYWLAK